MKQLYICIIFTLFIILVNYLSAQDSLQVFSISDRIGDEISVAEKNYYGFFPKIIGFTSAKIYNSDENILIKICYQLEGVSYDSIITWDNKIAKSVKNYVENLGSIPIGEMKINWSPIYPYIRPQHRSFRIGKKITINTITNNKYSGYLMTADSSHLSLWMSDAPYSWRMLKDSSIVFRNSEIKDIIIPKKGKAGGGFLIGILVGGGVGAVLGTNASFVDDKTIASYPILFGAIGGIIGLIVGKSTDKESTFKSDDLKFSVLLMDKPNFSNIPPPEIEEYVIKYKKDINN